MNLYKLAMTFVIAAVMLTVSIPAYGQNGYLNNQSQQLDFNLFQNFYTPQGPSMTTAAMYNAPHPVPYWVGSSMYTYQPYYPHEQLYQHSKNYYNYYGSADQFYSDNLRHGRGGDALNKTSVIYKSTGYHFGNFPFSSVCAQRLGYGIAAHKYGLRGSNHGLMGRGCRGGNCQQGCPTGNCQTGNCQTGNCQ